MLEADLCVDWIQFAWKVYPSQLQSTSSVVPYGWKYWQGIKFDRLAVCKHTTKLKPRNCVLDYIINFCHCIIIVKWIFANCDFRYNPPNMVPAPIFCCMVITFVLTIQHLFYVTYVCSLLVQLAVDHTSDKTPWFVMLQELCPSGFISNPTTATDGSAWSIFNPLWFTLTDSHSTHESPSALVIQTGLNLYLDRSYLLDLDL